MALLDICQDAAAQLGLRKPPAIIGSTDLTAGLLLRYANQAGKELMRYHDWQNLNEEMSFTSVAQIIQTGSIDADDYDRMVYNAEIWNTTLGQSYAGPMSQRLWRQLLVRAAGATVGWWRIKGNLLNICPAPTAGQTITYEYISKRWVESSDGDPQTHFLADTDTARIPEDLITLEIVWRYRHGRGYAQYAEDMRTCEIEKEKAASRDRGTGRIRPENRGDDSVANWPGTIGT